MVGWDGIEPPTPGFSVPISCPPAPPYSLPSLEMSHFMRAPEQPRACQGGHGVEQLEGSRKGVSGRSWRCHGLAWVKWTCGYMARPRRQRGKSRHARRLSNAVAAISTTVYAPSRLTPFPLPSSAPQRGEPCSQEPSEELAPLVGAWPGGRKSSSSPPRSVSNGWEPRPHMLRSRSSAGTLSGAA